MTQHRPSLGWAFFRSVPLNASLLLLAAVFFAFCTFGFLIDVSDLATHPASWLPIEVIGWGFVGAGYFLAATRFRAALPLVIVVHVALVTLADRLDVSDTSSVLLRKPMRDLKTRLTVDAVGVAAALSLGYACFMAFIRQEGSRYLRDHTEIALAKTVHDILVPPIASRSAQFEFYGASMPSGDVGGDLVDVVHDDANWIAYVADVSGHGVPAGVVMGMFKSAARMRLRSTATVDALFTDLNEVMFDLKSPNMFVTCACVRNIGSGGIEFGLAGHVPILHFKNSCGSVEELTAGHVPVGMFKESTFRVGRAAVAPGDLLLVLSDGLTEVFDAAGEEFGLDRVKQVVIEHSSASLQSLFDAVMSRVRAHGPQIDDQTLLLVRCCRSEDAAAIHTSRQETILPSG
jgi:serine phosphatase RsbU (regulator of sigma subunit)